MIFFPIDLYDTAGQRKNMLRCVLAHCNIEPDKDHIKQTIEQWTAHNPTPGNRFMALYDNHDLDQICFLPGPKNAELEYLKNKASIIKPFMQKLGYTELVW